MKSTGDPRLDMAMCRLALVARTLAFAWEEGERVDMGEMRLLHERLHQAAYALMHFAPGHFEAGGFVKATREPSPEERAQGVRQVVTDVELRSLDWVPEK